VLAVNIELRAAKAPSGSKVEDTYLSRGCGHQGRDEDDKGLELHLERLVRIGCRVGDFK
jgi:hypothetical protein